MWGQPPWEIAPDSGQFALFRSVNTLCLFPAQAFGHPFFATRKLCGSGSSVILPITVMPPPNPVILVHLQRLWHLHVSCSSSLVSGLRACFLCLTELLSSSYPGLLFHMSFLSFGAWYAAHSRCSIRTVGWLMLDGHLAQAFCHHS